LTAVHPHAQRAEGGERRELQPVAVAAEVQRAGLPSRRGGRRRRRWSHRPRRRHRRRWSGRRRRWWRRRRRRRRCTGQYRRGKWPSKTPPPDHPTTEPRSRVPAAAWAATADVGVSTQVAGGEPTRSPLSLSLSFSLSLRTWRRRQRRRRRRRQRGRGRRRRRRRRRARGRLACCVGLV
jgi:hypothetical protein